MVRMGLAKAKSLKMIGRACWKSNWEMLSDADVKPLYDRVMDHLLKQHPHGEFLAVQEIFGRDVAMELERKGEVIKPAHYESAGVMKTLQGKRRRAAGSDDEGSRRAGKQRAIEVEESESEMEL